MTIKGKLTQEERVEMLHRGIERLDEEAEKYVRDIALFNQEQDRAFAILWCLGLFMEIGQEILDRRKQKVKEDLN